MMTQYFIQYTLIAFNKTVAILILKAITNANMAQCTSVYLSTLTTLSQ